MSMHPMANFDGPAQEVMTGSYQILMNHRNTTLEVEHLLMSLLEQPGGFARHALEQLGMDLNLVKFAVEEKLAGFPQRQPEAGNSAISLSLYITPRLQKV